MAWSQRLENGGSDKYLRRRQRSVVRAARDGSINRGIVFEVRLVEWKVGRQREEGAIYIRRPEPGQVDRIE